jgi:hypothetical protein
MKKWEYKFAEIHPPASQIDSEEEFERLGKEGWELITTYTIPETKEGIQSMAIFKREPQYW